MRPYEVEDEQGAGVSLIYIQTMMKLCCAIGLRHCVISQFDSVVIYSVCALCAC